jgi:DUF1680 family protein
MPRPLSLKPVIMDTSKSKFARLRPVTLIVVRLKDLFWMPRLKKLREDTLPSQYQQLEETGRIDNFRRAAGKLDQPFEGWFFNDSDVYKWVEAAAWTLATHDDPELKKMVDEVISAIEAAQDEDGYLNTYFTFDRASERWTNLKDMHELYCAGHLIQAAIAHHRAMGEDRLLEVAIRFADHICETFGPEHEGKQPGTSGHPEIEMALVELSRTTGQGKYLEQARFFVDMRGRGLVGGEAYNQDHVPFRESPRMEGHAVRAVYLDAGATDLYAESGEKPLLEALQRLWSNMTTRHMYISGGVGSRYEGEAFGEDYELPNKEAYAETCAAIANVMWNWRMLMLVGEARFADVLEIALYNAVLVGLGLDGESYFYRNPLADDGDHHRQSWYPCACCPPNIARMLASTPGYFYSLSEEGVWMHLYAENTAQIQLLDGRSIGLIQRTNYPWDGSIEVEVQGEGEFVLFLRLPAWSDGEWSLTVNGKVVAEAYDESGYLKILRNWKPGDVVRLVLPMPVRLIESHPRVWENAGRVALMRGPLLYCLEGVDHPGVDLEQIVIPSDARFTAAYQPDLLGGVTILQTQGTSQPIEEVWDDRLYRHVMPPSERHPADLTAIPYHAWGNREAGQMRVWIRRDDRSC